MGVDTMGVPQPRGTGFEARDLPRLPPRTEVGARIGGQSGYVFGHDPGGRRVRREVVQ